MIDDILIRGAEMSVPTGSHDRTTPFSISATWMPASHVEVAINRDFKRQEPLIDPFEPPVHLLEPPIHVSA
jgi:hypothetical protein